MDDDGPDMLNDLPEPDPALDELAKAVIDACFAVHTKLGPGLLESHYERALAIELRKRRIPFVKQPIVELQYEDEPIGKCRLDFIIDHRIVLEIKSVDTLLPLHKAQLLTYLKIMNHRLGLLINFNVELLKKGIKRIINPYYKS